MDRKIIDFLPRYMQDMREVSGVMLVEQPEIDGLYDSITDVLHDQFVEIATQNGVSRWERILKISPKATETLDYRKFVILLRLNEKLPYTITMLRQRFDLICGKKNYVLEVDHLNYVLSIMIDVSLQEKYLEIVEYLRRTIPANLGLSSRLLMEAEPAHIYTAMHHTIATHITIAPYLLHDIDTTATAAAYAYTKCGMHITIYAKEE